METNSELIHKIKTRLIVMAILDIFGILGFISLFIMLFSLSKFSKMLAIPSNHKNSWWTILFACGWLGWIGIICSIILYIQINDLEEEMRTNNIPPQQISPVPIDIEQ